MREERNLHSSDEPPTRSEASRIADAPSELDEITRLLHAASEERSASDLLPLVYEELKRTARRQLSGGAPQTLQATALVHEAWMRVVGTDDPGWKGREHFFATAARAMRNILVEQFRAKGRLKRAATRAELSEAVEYEIAVEDSGADMLILDEALERLGAAHPFKARIVMLRFFTGLTMNEVAETLGVPLTRVERDWRFARAWLSKEVDGLQLD